MADRYISMDELPRYVFLSLRYAECPHFFRVAAAEREAEHLHEFEKALVGGEHVDWRGISRVGRRPRQERRMAPPCLLSAIVVMKSRTDISSSYWMN